MVTTLTFDPDCRPNAILSFMLRFVVASLALFSLSACAIDNPDAPNYVADFQAKSTQFEHAIQKNANTTQDFAQSYTDYERFLDQELNRAYQQLQQQLGATENAQLKQSQRQWLAFRDAEFAFITHNWNTINFGSSATISRGQYRSRLIKQRVLTLLYYLQNYRADL